MPLPKETQDEVLEYARNHLLPEKWHREYFSFVRNRDLRRRLGMEFWSARIVYKMMEGVGATKALKRAQVKTQVLQYASIYEAVIHYLLFTVYRFSPEVKELKSSIRRTKLTVAGHLLDKLEKQTRTNKSEIVVTRERPDKGDITKIRFESKADVAHKLGLIDEDLRDDLVELFSARNAIHLHAEIKKGTKYELALSRKAYKTLKPLKRQVESKLIADGKLQPPAA